MPGTNVVINFCLNGNDKLTDNFSFLIHEEFYTVSEYTEEAIHFIFNTYTGYPLKQYLKKADSVVFFEGLIYNKSLELLEEDINSIISAIREGNYNNKIKDFVQSSDGEYLITIFDKMTNKVVFINDYFNMLPVYYKIDKPRIIVSREPKFIIHFAEEIRFDKFAVLDFIRQEYTPGNRTLIDDMKTIDLGEILVVDIDNKTANIEKIFDFNFELSEYPYNSKTDALKDLYGLFMKSISDRANYFRNDDYKILADLSGGMDSRTVVGGLSKINAEFDCLTYEYFQDESIISKSVAESLGISDHFHKLSFENKILENRNEELLYKTDGLVNYQTTQICYNDMEYIKSKFTEKSVRFGGFGGDFIRHPFKHSCGGVLNSTLNAFYSKMTFEEIGDLFPDYKSEYFHYLKTLYESFPEKTIDGQLRRLYFYYQRNLVLHGGNERSRLHYWVVHPMMGSQFLQTIFMRFPLKWANFEFLTRFLEKINPDLLSVNLFQTKLNLRSTFSLNLYDLMYDKSRYYRSFERYTEYNLRWLYNFQLWIRKLIRSLYEIANSKESISTPKYDTNFKLSRDTALKSFQMYKKIISKKYTHKFKDVI